MEGKNDESTWGCEEYFRINRVADAGPLLGLAPVAAVTVARP